MPFTAKDVQALRHSTGAGMMDAKRALEANDGDTASATQWLREKGLAASAKREERESAQGAVAAFVGADVAAVVELTCETDFVAASEHFKTLVSDLAALVAHGGEDAVERRAEQVQDLKLRLKEKIELGRIVRLQAGEGETLDSYVHVQGGRGVNAAVVQLAGGTRQLAHDVAVHIAFARPLYLRKEDVPPEVVAKERATLEALSRNEGKPEQALPKIVEGRLGGFYKDVALLEQPYAKDDKVTIAQLLGDARVVRFAQVEVGRG
jgi:elongation factor Ts